MNNITIKKAMKLFTALTFFLGLALSGCDSSKEKEEKKEPKFKKYEKKETPEW